MPNKAQNTRRRENQAEAARRRAQSEQDKRKARRERDERIESFERYCQQQRTREIEPTPLEAKPPSLVVPESRPSSILQNPVMEARSDKFMQNIAQLFNNTKYSDATIIIHHKTLPVHKPVVCTQSAYFEKAFQEEFVEGSSGVLTFYDGSGAAHWRIFEYLYTGDYSDDLSNDFEDDPALLRDPRVYALADMFFLEDLKALSVTKLQQKLRDLRTCDSFSECVREVYTTTPDSDRAMRSAVVEVAKTHIVDFGKKAAFKDLIHQGGDFAVDLFETAVIPAVSNTYHPSSVLFGGGSRVPSAWG